MSSDWKNCQLGDVLTLQRGFDLPTRKRQDGDIPVVSSSGISGYHNEAKVKAPGVVTGRYGTLGEVFYISKDFWPLNTTLYVRDFKGNDQKFISYFLQTLNLAHQNAAGAVPGLNRNALHLLPVKCPPLSIQRKIAAILSAYDDLIENNMRRIEILEEMARSLYREWFVNFRFPGHEQVKMVDSELGLIPEGWEEISLGQILDIKHGYAFKGEYFCKEPTSDILLTPGNFKFGGGFKDDKLKYYDGPVPDEFVLSAGELLVTMTDLSKEGDTLGYPAFVPPSKNLRFLHNQRLGKIILRNPRLGLNHLYHIFCSDSYRHHVLASATGATVKHTAPDRIKSFNIALPPSDICNRFETLASLFSRKIVLLNQRNQNIRQTRELLLPKIISGEIDVENLDINTGEIAA